MMKSVTQAEFNRQFYEYIKDKEVNRDNILELMLEYEKLLKAQGLTIRAGVAINSLGKVIYDDI